MAASSPPGPESLTATAAPSSRRNSSIPSLSLWPSQEQGRAIEQLSAFQVSEVVDCIEYLHSIQPPMKREHVMALADLYSAPLDNLRRWLAFNHQQDDSYQKNTSAASQNPLTPPLTGGTFARGRTSSPKSSFKAATSEPAQSSPASEHQAGEQDHESRDTSAGRRSTEPQEKAFKIKRRLSPAPKRKHYHWCTSHEHEHDREIGRTCDGFKRHEKEVEEHYLFMPSGPIEETSQGKKCALCDQLDPQKEHLQMHDVFKYVGATSPPIKKSRKSNFENLLKTHKAHGIKKLVRCWRTQCMKNSYSCGLCIKFFPTLSERSNHYCSAHFAKGEDLEHWDEDNVIKGHLLRPELHEECLKVFGTDPCHADAGFSWCPERRAALRGKLELGLETTRELALAASSIACPPKQRCLGVETSSRVQSANVLLQFQRQARSEVSQKESPDNNSSPDDPMQSIVAPATDAQPVGCEQNRPHQQNGLGTGSVEHVASPASLYRDVSVENPDFQSDPTPLVAGWTGLDPYSLVTNLDRDEDRYQEFFLASINDAGDMIWPDNATVQEATSKKPVPTSNLRSTATESGQSPVQCYKRRRPPRDIDVEFAQDSLPKPTSKMAKRS